MHIGLCEGRCWHRDLLVEHPPERVKLTMMQGTHHPFSLGTADMVPKEYGAGQMENLTSAVRGCSGSGQTGSQDAREPLWQNEAALS